MLLQDSKEKLENSVINFMAATHNLPIANVSMLGILTCGITVILDLKSWSPNVDMSWPSTKMLPETISKARNKDSMSEDLPAPVRPTMAIW